MIILFDMQTKKHKINTLCIYFAHNLCYIKLEQEESEMKDIYLTRYSVKGIKTLDQLISLSFYKKRFQRIRIHRNIILREYMV